jgi:hypothetical protein
MIVKKAESDELVEIKRLCGILPTSDQVVALKEKVDTKTAEFSRENAQFKEHF